MMMYIMYMYMPLVHMQGDRLMHRQSTRRPHFTPDLEPAFVMVMLHPVPDSFHSFTAVLHCTVQSTFWHGIIQERFYHTHISTAALGALWTGTGNFAD